MVSRLTSGWVPGGLRPSSLDNPQSLHHFPRDRQPFSVVPDTTSTTPREGPIVSPYSNSYTTLIYTLWSQRTLACPLTWKRPRFPFTTYSPLFEVTLPVWFRELFSPDTSYPVPSSTDVLSKGPLRPVRTGPTSTPPFVHWRRRRKVTPKRLPTPRPRPPSLPPL